MTYLSERKFLKNRYAENKYKYKYEKRALSISSILENLRFSKPKVLYGKIILEDFSS